MALMGLQGNAENLAYLSFWAYNTTILLHLLCSDKGLHAACIELNLLNMIEELINAIHGEFVSYRKNPADRLQSS
jgi:hypothetical protein